MNDSTCSPSIGISNSIKNSSHCTSPNNIIEKVNQLCDDLDFHSVMKVMINQFEKKYNEKLLEIENLKSKLRYYEEHSLNGNYSKNNQHLLVNPSTEKWSPIPNSNNTNKLNISINTPIKSKSEFIEISDSEDETKELNNSSVKNFVPKSKCITMDLFPMEDECNGDYKEKKFIPKYLLHKEKNYLEYKSTLNPMNQSKDSPLPISKNRKRKHQVNLNETNLKYRKLETMLSLTKGSTIQNPNRETESDEDSEKTVSPQSPDRFNRFSNINNSINHINHSEHIINQLNKSPTTSNQSLSQFELVTTISLNSKENEFTIQNYNDDWKLNLPSEKRKEKLLASIDNQSLDKLNET